MARVFGSPLIVLVDEADVRPMHEEPDAANGVGSPLAMNPMQLTVLTVSDIGSPLIMSPMRGSNPQP